MSPRHTRLVIPNSMNAFRNHGYDDGEAGRPKLTEFPDDKCRAAYLQCYRRGTEKRRGSDAA